MKDEDTLGGARTTSLNKRTTAAIALLEAPAMNTHLQGRSYVMLDDAQVTAILLVLYAMSARLENE